MHSQREHLLHRHAVDIETVGVISQSRKWAKVDRGMIAEGQQAVTEHDWEEWLAHMRHEWQQKSFREKRDRSDRQGEQNFAAERVRRRAEDEEGDPWSGINPSKRHHLRGKQHGRGYQHPRHFRQPHLAPQVPPRQADQQRDDVHRPLGRQRPQRPVHERVVIVLKNSGQVVLVVVEPQDGQIAFDDGTLKVRAKRHRRYQRPKHEQAHQHRDDHSRKDAQQARPQKLRRCAPAHAALEDKKTADEDEAKDADLDEIAEAQQPVCRVKLRPAQQIAAVRHDHTGRQQEARQIQIVCASAFHLV